MNQRRRLVRLLLDNDARQDIDSSSGTCEQLAGKDAETLAILSEYPKGVISGLTDIMEDLKVAAEGSNLDRLVTLLDNRSFSINDIPDPPSYSSDNRTWLHIAAMRGNRRLINTLLKAENIDVNARSSLGWTPLHEASQIGVISICHDFLEAGADVTIASTEGLLALHLYVAHNYETKGFLETYEFLEVFEKLLAVDRPTNFANFRSLLGDTPLHCACRASALINTGLLLQAGASPDACNTAGARAIHLAITARNPPLVRVLLAAGADPSLKHTQYGSCIDMAKSASCPELVTILKDAIIR